MQTFREFFQNFPDEESCQIHFKNYRDKVGVACKKCEGKDHYWLSTIKYYKCKQCGFRTSLRSGTVMEYSKLPFEYWYLAMMLMSSTKKSFSAHEVRRQTGHKFYEPVWHMMHKLRKVMGKRDEKYLLKDFVEIDEAFYVMKAKREVDELGNVLPKEDMKRGKGSPRVSQVLVMSESLPVKDAKNKFEQDRIVKHIKMIHIPDNKAITIFPEIDKSVEKNAIAITDGANHYNQLNLLVKNHVSYKGKEASKYLPWVHKTISNSKRNILGIHHSIGEENIQNYLNEFCFKFNRRYNRIDTFDRLVNAATLYKSR